ncbi:unnamed protein product [Ambrosiozyma monospora]|uniref:Unnamed protein product n=1 Tax=Ambrosiozyma monospora TaxID=43982 RepID=A0A9W6YYK1_AMBMO|nr:unnamed protein product [Ambrosiozyma monospora]
MAPNEQHRLNYHPPRTPKDFPTGPRKRAWYDRDDRDRQMHRDGDRGRNWERNRNGDRDYNRDRDNGDDDLIWRDQNGDRDHNRDRDHSDDDLIYGRDQNGDRNHYRDIYRYRDRSRERNRTNNSNRSNQGYNTISFGTNASYELNNFCGTCGFKGHNRGDPGCPKFDLRKSNVPRDFYCEACGLKGHFRKNPECPVFSLHGPSRQHMIDHIHKTEHKRTAATTIGFGTNASYELNNFCGTCGFKGHSRGDPGCPKFDLRKSNVPRDFYCEACGLKGHFKKNPECPVFSLRGPSRQHMIDHIHKTEHKRTAATTIGFGTNASYELNNFCGTCGLKGHSRGDPGCPKFDLRKSNVPRDFYCEACGLKGHFKKNPECPVFSLRGPSRQHMIDHIHKTEHKRTAATTIGFGTNASYELNNFCGTCGFKGHMSCIFTAWTIETTYD